MKENEYKVAGYSFRDKRAYKEAKQEAETIDYIRKNTDLNDKNKALKLYQKLVERKTMKTIVGYEFLYELQKMILKDGFIDSDKLPPIPIGYERKNQGAWNSSLEQNQVQKYKRMAEDYKIRHRNSRIINIFLLLIIIGMFIINIFGDRSVFKNYEEEIISKYSAWEEELKERERNLHNSDINP
jgi:hypothetical protein